MSLFDLENEEDYNTPEDRDPDIIARARPVE